MANIRFHAAVIAAKLAEKLIRLLGRNGSHTPGAIALKICPNFLGLAPRPKTLICVTGTNGKTSVTNMLSDALEELGCTVAAFLPIAQGNGLGGLRQFLLGALGGLLFNRFPKGAGQFHRRTFFRRFWIV